MRKPDLWSRTIAHGRPIADWARDETGSASALFLVGTSVMALVVLGALHLLDILQVPVLVFLLLAVFIGFSAWDYARLRRRQNRQADHPDRSDSRD